MNTVRLSWLFGIASAFAILLSIMAGPVWLSPANLWSAATGDGPPIAAAILLEVRLPRAIAAALAGLALGASGQAMQSLLRNPLAEPGTLGVSASAALGATTIVYFGLAESARWLVPIAAMAAAGLASGFALTAGRRQRGVASLILVGIAVSAFAGAVMALFVNLTPNPFSLSDLINWTAGSVANRDWVDIVIAAPCIGVGLVLLYVSRGGQAAMLFGDEAAFGMGVDLRRLRLFVVLGTAAATGGAVALAGMIGFVGLIAPHVVRLVGGSAVRDQLPSSAFAAALMLVLADLMIRLSPGLTELHLGTVTALVGAPLFAIIAVRVGSVRHG
jgi:iron complex transport system permease protein